jgi:hypothetical protein
MEINIGMTREGFRKLANEINAQLAIPLGCVEVERYVEHNGSGPELKLVLSDDDMSGDHITSPDAAYWEQM